ncbi:MAG TPA: PAS domain-containing protein, partial [Anaeromyxobacteraceae bacterium]|nr:PAS domain-containing protein [Anaeromyxobacteraceae bacterium]
MGAWHWDIASGELVWSERCKELFGLRPETEMSYEVFLAAIHPDDRARVDRTVKATLASGTPYEIEMRVPWSDGSVHWIASKGEAFHADGRPVRMAGMAMDITARKTAEEALRRSETNLRQYAELVEYAPILVRNLGAEIVVWNEGMEKLYGWARGEVLGRVTHDVLCTRFPAPLADIMAILMREGRWEGELVHRHRDGSEMVVASVWTLHRDDDGRPAAVIEVSTDITALKRAEEALREADRRKDEFIGILSHELRNPLAPIRNSVQILHRVDPATPQAESARAIIARQVEHLARLVDDLLDVRRITTGKLRLHTAVMDLTEQVSETVEDLRPLFVTRSLSLDLQLPTRPVWVDGDRTRLGQLLGNLLHNAAKFTSAGGRVSVVVEAEERHAHIRVRDDGIGISPELRQALFDAFVQSDRTIHRTQGGLGLGLSLVRGIAELHGGSVVARSEGIGKGAEFVVTLSTTDPGPGVAAEPAATRTATRTRVLIIEDNLDAAESLRQVVEMLGGHEVEVAHDGVAGFDAARQLRPDVVLCDIGLPRMDGYEVARRLRASGLAPQPRLVAITGYAAADDVDRAMRAGFDYHVAKPPDIDQVLKLVADPPSSRPDIAVPAEIATGHQEVDAQHACILVAAARLRAAGPAGVREALRFLQQHASSHFEYEDKLMEDVGFPKVAAHKQQHASFLSQLRAFQEAVEREGRPGATPENLEALASTVEAWVNQHVLEQDRLVAEFLREQRPDQAAATGSRPRRLRLV